MGFREFVAVLEGYGERVQDDRYLHAAMTANLLTPHLKKGRRVTAEKLLGIKRKPVRLSIHDYPDVESYRRAVRELRDAS